VTGLAKFRKFFGKVNEHIDIKYLREPEEEEMGDEFSGKKIVMTGFRSGEMIEFIEKNSGEITSSVSKNTSLVICADEADGSSKLLKAKKLNIPIITKSKFIAKYMK
jgi:NAD-dependent DNA ligase